MTNQNVIGLTATAFNEDFELERLHLERQGFKIYNSGLSGFIDPATATSKATVQQFFKQSEGYAKLIFAQGSAAETFLEQAIQPPNETDCKDLERLKHLVEQDVLLVRNTDLMRGIDYRVAAGTMGISLLIMSGFENKRAYVQALGRVGRFHEKAKRFVWDQLPQTVDEMAQMRLMGVLREQQVKPVEKTGPRKTGKNKPAPVWQRSALELFKKQPITINLVEDGRETQPEEQKDGRAGGTNEV